MLDNIYVDQLRMVKWRYSQSCHLFTTGAIEDLHSFAKNLGLKRKWFQNDFRLPHYDLSAKKQRLAIQKGARLAKYNLVKGIIRRCQIDT